MMKETSKQVLIRERDSIRFGLQTLRLEMKTAEERVVTLNEQMAFLERKEAEIVADLDAVQ